MLTIIDEYFRDYPARRRVVEILYTHGIAVKETEKGPKMYLGDVEVPITAVADAARVNRKIVYHTLEYIVRTYELKVVFEQLKPTTNLVDVAPVVGWEAIEVEIEPEAFCGAVSSLLRIFASRSYCIKQVMGGEEPTGKLVIIVDREIPESMLSCIREVHGIKSITLYTHRKGRNLACTWCRVKVCPRRVALEESTGKR